MSAPAPRIRVETGRGYAIGVCPACPSWRPLAGDRAGILTAAAWHLEAAHGDAELAGEYRERAGRSRRHRDTPRRP